MMRGLLYTISVLLIVIWGIGYFAFGHGSAIHILLVIAFIIIAIRMVEDIKGM